MFFPDLGARNLFEVKIDKRIEKNSGIPTDQTSPAWNKLVISFKGDHVIAHTNLGGVYVVYIIFFVVAISLYF